MKKITLLLTLVAMVTWSAFAGGYQVRLQGQKQTGFGLIGTPFSFGASSIFYNPGALAMMKAKTNFQLGASGILSNVTFQKSATNYQANTDNPLGTPFYFYGARKVTDNLTVGVGVYTPFGTTSKWEDDWAGRFLVQNISLKAIFVQPTVSYKINDMISVGAGFVYAMGDVELNKALSYNDNSSVNIKGSTNSIGYNLGVYIKPIEELSIGIDYRSEVVMEMEEGDAVFTIPASLSGTIPENNKFSASLPMPANLDVGFAYQLTEDFMLAAEINYVFWSIYDSLNFTFEENGEMLNSNNPRLYENKMIIRLGGQYILNDNFTLRVGGYYDPSPTNEDYFTPETVSLNTTAFTFGFTYKPIKNLCIDVSYLHIMGEEADKSYDPANFSGTYKTQAAIPGFGISYNF